MLKEFYEKYSNDIKTTESFISLPETIKLQFESQTKGAMNSEGFGNTHTHDGIDNKGTKQDESSIKLSEIRQEEQVGDNKRVLILDAAHSQSSKSLNANEPIKEEESVEAEQVSNT